MKTCLAAAVSLALLAPASQAALIITEVHSTGSSSAYNADWFELTNTGPGTVDLTGYKVDDNSNSSASAVPIRGITSITAGQTVVFAESNSSGSNDPTITTNFINAWFGGTAPAGFTLAFYAGSNVGFSSTADAVNLFDSLGTAVARLDFGAATAGTTFDNSAGLNNVTLSTLSAAGVDGAFTAPSGEIGSPGVVTLPIPEPASVALLAWGAAALVLRRRRA
jgi:hypothetical protein